jgi:myo-inositol 2-dehydrogenase/D-chiro-inositol 1-dehydrogenase
MPEAPTALAVFGAGRIGAVHAGNAATLPNVKLAGVADIDREAARRLASAHGTRVDEVAALLADPAIAGVVIATPTGSHPSLIEQAARAGKHVFVEKPVSLDIAETVAATAVAHAAGVILQVGFQRRFDDEFLLARKAVESGDLGSPRFLRLVGRDHRVPPIGYLRTSGGQFKDQMIHEFDLAAWLFRPARIVEVYAVGSTIVEPALRTFGDADTTVAVLRYDSGALGVIDGSREAAYGYDVRAELVGSNGMILVGGGHLADDKLLGESAATPESESFVERFAAAYRAELADFAEAIRRSRSPRVGGADALEALRLASAATTSFREGRLVALRELGDG